MLRLKVGQMPGSYAIKFLNKSVQSGKLVYNDHILNQRK